MFLLIQKMLKQPSSLLNGRKVQSTIKSLLHMLSVIAIPILMILLFALSVSLTGIILVFSSVTVMTCFILGYMKDAVKSKTTEIEDSIFGQGFTIKVL